MSCQEMDPLGMYMELKLDPFINEDMKDFSWDSDLDQVINDYLLFDFPPIYNASISTVLTLFDFLYGYFLKTIDYVVL